MIIKFGLTKNFLGVGFLMEELMDREMVESPTTVVPATDPVYWGRAKLDEVSRRGHEPS